MKWLEIEEKILAQRTKISCFNWVMVTTSIFMQQLKSGIKLQASVDCKRKMEDQSTLHKRLSKKFYSLMESWLGGLQILSKGLAL